MAQTNESPFTAAGHGGLQEILPPPLDSAFDNESFSFDEVNSMAPILELENGGPALRAQHVNEAGSLISTSSSGHGADGAHEGTAAMPSKLKGPRDEAFPSLAPAADATATTMSSGTTGIGAVGDNEKRNVDDEQRSNERPVSSVPPCGLKSSHDYKTPFGINRYIIIVIITAYVTFVGTHFFNWPPWEKILLNDGAYVSLCGDGPPRCAEQIAAVRALLPIATVSMFSFTFLAGLLLDIIGPKVCCLFGTTLLITGWALLVASGPTVNTYAVGFILMAAGSDPAFFGTLSVSNLFPAYSSTVISILGAARSLSNLWPLLLLEISQGDPNFGFSAMASIFLGVYIGCLLVVVFLVPMTPYEPPALPVEAIVHHHHHNDEPLPLSQQTSIAVAGAPAACTELVLMQHPEPSSVHPLASGGGSQRLRWQENASASNVVAFSRICEPDVPPGITSGWRKSWMSLTTQLRRLLHHCKDPGYIPIIIICIANVIRNNFYLTTATTQLGPAEASFFSFLNVLAFIPGPICGFLVDTYGPLYVILGINTANLLVFVALIIAEFATGVFQSVLRYSSVVLVFPGVGFLLSQVYCYIAVYFPPEDMGKLAGFASFIAGLCGLVVPSMTRLTEVSGQYWPMNIVNVGLSIVTYLCTGFLLWVVAKRHRQNQMTVSALSDVKVTG